MKNYSLVLGLCFLLSACSSAEKATTTDSGADGSSSAEGLVSSAGVIASPFTTSESRFINLKRLIRGERTVASPAELRAQIDDLLAVNTGDVEDCKSLMAIDLSTIQGISRATCYGPNVTLAGNHPDTNSVQAVTLPSGDVGIWDSTDVDEQACAAAQVNAIVDYAASMTFQAMLAAAYVACFAVNSGMDIPDTEGEELEFTDAQQDALDAEQGLDAFGGLAATITGIVDSDDVFGLRFDIEADLEDGDVPRSVTGRFVVQYTQHEDGVLKGTASYTVLNEDGIQGNCPSSEITYAGKETYVQNAAGDLITIELRHAEFCGDASPLDEETFDIDFTDKYANPANTTGWGNNANYVLFSYDPSTYVGTYALSWQAGLLDDATRIFTAEISDATTGVAYFGFGDDIDEPAELAEIDGMICNWAGPGNTKTVQDYVQRQAITLADGIWGVDSEDIRFAPTNTCDNPDPVNPGGDYVTFRYNANSSAPFMSNDFRASWDGTTTFPANAAATIDLYDVSSYDLTLPTPPTF